MCYVDFTVTPPTPLEGESKGVSSALSAVSYFFRSLVL